MQRRKLAHEAEQFRRRAQSLPEPQRDLLLKIAETFDDIATAEARKGVDETRCW